MLHRMPSTQSPWPFLNVDAEFSYCKRMIKSHGNRLGAGTTNLYHWPTLPVNSPLSSCYYRWTESQSRSCRRTLCVGYDDVVTPAGNYLVSRSYCHFSGDALHGSVSRRLRFNEDQFSAAPSEDGVNYSVDRPPGIIATRLNNSFHKVAINWHSFIRNHFNSEMEMLNSVFDNSFTLKTSN